MAPGLAQQNVIAVVWDFDKTLTPQYMQEPLFRHYQVDPAEFWAEVNALPAYYASQGLAHIPNDSVYLNHILTYVRHGVFAGLNNALLRRLGGQIDFYAGLPDFFDQLRASIAEHPDYSRAAITLEHYVVSTGLRELIVGSDIYDHVDGVWGCEFAEHVAPPGFLHDGAQVEMADTRTPPSPTPRRPAPSSNSARAATSALISMSTPRSISKIDGCPSAIWSASPTAPATYQSSRL